jgi:hypothetical protein
MLSLLVLDVRATSSHFEPLQWRVTGFLHSISRLVFRIEHNVKQNSFVSQFRWKVWGPPTQLGPLEFSCSPSARVCSILCLPTTIVPPTLARLRPPGFLYSPLEWVRNMPRLVESYEFFSWAIMVALGIGTGRNLLKLVNELSLERSELYVFLIYIKT